MSKFGLVFLLVLAAATAAGSIRAVSADHTRQLAPGVAANERLTATLGAVLFVLLAAIAITILFIQPLLQAHYVVGLLMVPPVALKLMSTGYRFARYYLRDRDYRLAGAPPLLLRFVVAPILVLSTVAVFVTGVELWLVGLRFGSVWMTAHTVSAVFFVIGAGLHLLGHARRSAVAAVEEVSAPIRSEGSRRRSVVAWTLIVAVAVAVAVAAVIYPSPFPPAAVG